MHSEELIAELKHTREQRIVESSRKGRLGKGRAFENLLELPAHGTR